MGWVGGGNVFSGSGSGSGSGVVSCSLFKVRTIYSSSSSSLLLFPIRHHHHHHRLSSSIRSRLIIDTTQPQTSTTPSSSSSSSSVFSRRLILLRHAHSSSPHHNNSIRDHDRPLSQSGQADAVRVSNKLQQLGWIPQLILSSDAARTKETLSIMQEQVRGFFDAEVHYISSFYSIAALDGQTAQHLQQAICKLSTDDVSTVMCMGHNRGWEEAASMFSGKLIELKTCNAALLEATGETWKEAFSLAGFGGWKLLGIVKPNLNLDSL